MLFVHVQPCPYPYQSLTITLSLSVIPQVMLVLLVNVPGTGGKAKLCPSDYPCVFIQMSISSLSFLSQVLYNSHSAQMVIHYCSVEDRPTSKVLLDMTCL